MIRLKYHETLDAFTKDPLVGRIAGRARSTLVGWIKLNIDESVQKEMEKSGAGGLLRNKEDA